MPDLQGKKKKKKDAPNFDYGSTADTVAKKADLESLAFLFSPPKSHPTVYGLGEPYSQSSSCKGIWEM